MPLPAETRLSAPSPGAHGAAGKAALWQRLVAPGGMRIAAFMLVVVVPQLLGTEWLVGTTRADVIPETVVEQEAALEAHDQTLRPSHETKLQLAALRENPVADAAETAGSRIAAIGEQSRPGRNTALVALGAGVLLIAGVGLYARQRARTPKQTPGAASGPSSEERARQERLARAADLTRRYHQAQRNLDYWRDFLAPKLHRTVAAVLCGAPPDDEQPDVEAPLAAVAEVRAPVDEPPALPDPLPELIDGIASELWSVAGRATDAGLEAVADCMAAAAANGASTEDCETASVRALDPPDREAPLLSLQAAAEATEQVVVRIGLCLSAINALAVASSTSGSAAETATPEPQAVADRLQDLFEELVIARERLGTKARELG